MPIPLLIVSDAQLKRFWNRVDKHGPLPNPEAEIYPEIKGVCCWTWTGSPDRDGYGSIRIQPHPFRVTRANRVGFFIHYGYWPNPCCLHKCDNVRCVRGPHLFEGTIADNNRDRAEKGRSYMPKEGTVHFSAKLSIEQVKEIRALRGLSQNDIAKEFGISQAQVCRIRTGQLWTHVREA